MKTRSAVGGPTSGNLVLEERIVTYNALRKKKHKSDLIEHRKEPPIQDLPVDEKQRREVRVAHCFFTNDQIILKYIMI